MDGNSSQLDARAVAVMMLADFRLNHRKSRAPQLSAQNAVTKCDAVRSSAWIPNNANRNGYNGGKMVDRQTKDASDGWPNKRPLISSAINK